MKKKPSEIAGIAVVVAALLGGVAWLYGLASQAAAPMKNDEFLRVTRQLASDARESARLAALAATGQVNEHYARNQHEKLSEDVKDASKKLDAPPPRERPEDAKRAGELATHMKDLLDNAAPHLADRAAMQQLQDEHARIAAELERIASR